MKTLDGLHFAKVNLCCSTRPCHSQTRSALQWDSCSTYSQGCAVRIVVCSVGDSAPSWCANSYDPAMFELVRRTYATSTSDNSSNANKVSSGTGTGRPGVPSCNNAPVPGGKTYDVELGVHSSLLHCDTPRITTSTWLELGLSNIHQSVWKRV
eukprot:m.405889 g.405889  ORF g.405889 m.405889 type:complete len:153 (-) comp21211_c0_seq4:1506-1964(-)